MNLETAQSLSTPQFKRRFGVQPETFKQMVKALQTQQPNPSSPGRPSALSVEAEIWVTLEYWREYRLGDFRSDCLSHCPPS